MTKAGTLKVTTPTDREIAMTRVFDAPKRMVFAALTRPELIQRWLGVFGGWSMDVCEVDLKVGGTYRYVWRGPDGAEMGLCGVFRENRRARADRSTESFDEPWYPGEAVGTITLVEQEGRTKLETTMRYDSREIRDAVLKSPMEQGVAASYDKLDELLASEARGR